MTVYYNEYDKKTAAWLRELIRAGVVAPGVVDDRSIEDVRPSDLAGFNQCHFFAGIGVWSFALRAAGWPDDRPVWTGSCPCQPFSAAGQGVGFADERHLWPAFYHLVGERRPATVLGEQVASKDADPWIDLVQDDLEALGYAVGAVPFPSAGVGAPHIRDRLYWAANAGGAGLEKRERVTRVSGRSTGRGAWETAVGAGVCDVIGLGDSNGAGRQSVTNGARGDGAGVESTRSVAVESGETSCNAGIRPGPTNGFWRDADWLGCRDGKWRSVEPGTFPLAHGAPARVLRLRGYGNAINAKVAQAWAEIVMEILDEKRQH